MTGFHEVCERKCENCTEYFLQQGVKKETNVYNEVAISLALKRSLKLQK
jgi:hypothetical protein